MEIEYRSFNHLSFSISEKKWVLILNGQEIEPRPEECKVVYHPVKDKDFYFTF